MLSRRAHPSTRRPRSCTASEEGHFFTASLGALALNTSQLQLGVWGCLRPFERRCLRLFMHRAPLMNDIYLQTNKTTKFSRNTYEFLTNYSPINYELPNTYEIQNTYEILTKYLRNTYEILTRYLRDTYQILTKYLRDTYDTLTRYLRHT